MQTYTSNYSPHSAVLASAGYVQVQASARGRLFYIPEHIYRAIYQETSDSNSYPPAVFQTRLVRPHRIHIARVHAEVGALSRSKAGNTNHSPPSRKGKRKTVSVIFEKTGLKSSARRLFRSIINNQQQPVLVEGQTDIEVASSTVVPEPTSNPRPPVRTVSDSIVNLPNSTRQTSSRKPSLRRPTSWAPGLSSESRMRPSALLSRKESKRRSAAISMPSGGMRNSVANLARSSPVQTAAPSAVLLPTEDITLNGAGSPRLSSSAPSVNEVGNLRTSRPSTQNRPSNGVSKMMMVEEKPLASGTGVTVSIALAEPYLFLQGFEQSDLQASRSTAMLRGNMRIKITKQTKIKTVSLRFKGTAITRWPEGIPNKKSETEEINTLMSHTWPFFNAQFPNAEYSTGADEVELQGGDRGRSNSASRRDDASTNGNGNANANANKRGSLDLRDLLNRANTGSSSNLSSSLQEKRLSLQPDPARFARTETSGSKSQSEASVAQKGYKVFQPGEYVYNFELPLDSHLPETINVELGAVKYELEATVERAGAFRGNLAGTKEVVLIRTPAEGSLEQIEPIAIARTWDDQLHYDIVISGKSFPLGSQIPIAFKLTPLAKVHCHRVKVYITESVEYFCDNRRVHRTEPARRMLLCEKRADGRFTSTYAGSTIRVVSGGGVPYDMRAAAARGENVQGLDPDNLLGRLESGAAHDIGPTELEICAQLPTCENMKQERDRMARLHPDTTYTNIQVHHWIKIVLRLSRPDAVEPGKRRHFEISIDSPFHILNCRAREGNLFLPAYIGNGVRPEQGEDVTECGCPGSRCVRKRTTSGSAPSPHPLSRELERTTTANGVPAPPAAHIAHAPRENMARPIHIMRVPSYNPPAFDEELPPPPLETPPPGYDTIASPTTGMADYFARYSDAYAVTTITPSSSTTTESSEMELDEEDGDVTPTGRRSPA